MIRCSFLIRKKEWNKTAGTIPARMTWNVGTMKRLAISKPNASRKNTKTQKNIWSRRKQKTRLLLLSNKSDRLRKNWAHIVCNKVFVNLGSSAYMIEALSVITRKAVPSDIRIGTAGRDIIQATFQGECDIRMTGGENPKLQSYVLHVPKRIDGLVSVVILHDDNHAIKLTNKKYIVKKKNCVAGIGERTEAMSSPNQQRTNKTAFAALIDTGHVPCVWHWRLAHANRYVAKKMAKRGSLQGLDMNTGHSATNC